MEPNSIPTATTVAELIKILQEMDPDILVYSMGADIGGYDVSQQHYVAVVSLNEKAIVLRHLEYERYEPKRSVHNG